MIGKSLIEHVVVSVRWCSHELHAAVSELVDGLTDIIGGHGNVAAICTALIASLQFRGISSKGRHAWYFPTTQEYTNLLQTVGFRVESVELIPRPTPLPKGMASWLDTFASPFFHGLDPDLKDAIFDNTLNLLAHSLSDGQGNWTADYVRIRVVAHA